MTSSCLVKTTDSRASSPVRSARQGGWRIELLRSRRYEVVFVDTELMDGALERMARFADKRLSLTDCASFAFMERLGLATAFAFDRDFRDCGYATIP